MSRHDHQKLTGQQRTSHALRAFPEVRPRRGAQVFPAKFEGKCFFGGDMVEVGDRIAMWEPGKPYHPRCAVGGE